MARHSTGQVAGVEGLLAAVDAEFGDRVAACSCAAGLMVSRKPHPAELRERAVNLVFELRAETGNARVGRSHGSASGSASIPRLSQLGG